MERFFIAIPITGPARDHILAAQPPSPKGIRLAAREASDDVRLIAREELHLTLHFLGELTPTAEQLATDVLKKLHFDAFAITLQGVGSFATKDGAHALWVGVDPNPNLTALHSAIAGTLAAAIDYKPEARPYQPHITIARLGPLAADAAAQFATQHATFHFAPHPVTEFALYTSSFAGNVPRYQLRDRYGLSEPTSEYEPRTIPNE